jgi:uncharacterized protein (TIRG00374 family)
MSKKHLIFLAKFAVSVSLLALVLNQMDLDEVASRLETMSARLLIAAVACLAVQAIAIVTWRWHVILQSVYTAVMWMRLARMVTIGLFFNQVLASTFRGDGFRIWLLSRTETPLDVALRSVVLDRGFGLFGLFLLSLAASLSLMVSLGQATVVLGAILLSALGTISIIYLPFFLRLLQALPFARLRHHLATFGEDLRSVLRAKTTLAALLSISVIGHILICFSVWLTAWSLDIEIPLGGTLAVVPPVLLAAALPISISGWGVREGGMIFGLGMLGVSSGDAVLVSVMVV